MLWLFAANKDVYIASCIPRPAPLQKIIKIRQQPAVLSADKQKNTA